MRVAVTFAVLFLLSAVAARASEPIIIEAGLGRNWAAIKLMQKADEQLKKGDLENARRNVDAAIRSDPTLWPAFETRAELFIRQHKWEPAIQDCNTGLKQQPTFVEFAVLRAIGNERLGRYSASLPDLDNVVRLRPARPAAFAAALNQRAWLRATCPDASFRNGKQAISDAKQAYNLTAWKDADMIDTLAVACAEVGDFDSAVRYETQAMSAPDSNDISRLLQERLALFKQRRTVRDVSK